MNILNIEQTTLIKKATKNIITIINYNFVSNDEV